MSGNFRHFTISIVKFSRNAHIRRDAVRCDRQIPAHETRAGAIEPVPGHLAGRGKILKYLALLGLERARLIPESSSRRELRF
jgi:hypothetical protein